eukprot:4396070-Amphidinium_carterae.1
MLGLGPFFPFGLRNFRGNRTRIFDRTVVLSSKLLFSRDEPAKHFAEVGTISLDLENSLVHHGLLAASC